eukprot:g17009.t1
MALPSCHSIFIQCVPHRIDFSDSPSSRLQNHSIQYGNHFEIHSDIPSLNPIVTSVTSAFKAYRRISANRRIMGPSLHQLQTSSTAGQFNHLCFSLN